MNAIATLPDGKRPATSLFDLTPDSLGSLFKSWKEPSYRITQVFEWLYVKGACSYDEMTNLPKSLRARLEAELTIYRSDVARELRSSDGTVKRLLAWNDGASSECVLIPDDKRRTACISSQVGCPVRCVFCASGLDGLERQLAAGEIIEQTLRIRELCGESSRLSNVVFMGSGEPLLNYDNMLQAVRTIMAPWGLGIGARKITVSTVGYPAQMRKLADEKLQITLALSLHAPTDELRRQVIPQSNGVTIAELVEACKYYFERTGREITLEYILLKDLNDNVSHASQLASVARKMRSNVNLICYNNVAGLSHKRSSDENSERFLDELRKRGINAHLRRSRGSDIDSACGQLAGRTPKIEVPGRDRSTSPRASDQNVEGNAGKGRER